MSKGGGILAGGKGPNHPDHSDHALAARSANQRSQVVDLGTHNFDRAGHQMTPPLI